MLFSTILVDVSCSAGVGVSALVILSVGVLTCPELSVVFSLLDSHSLVVELIGLIGHFTDVIGSGFFLVLLVKFVIFGNLLDVLVLDMFYVHVYVNELLTSPI